MFSKAAAELVLGASVLGALALPLVAGPRLQKIEWATTDTATVPANGTLRIEGTLGDLNVETCDCTDVKISVARYRFGDEGDKAAFEKELKGITVTVKPEGGGAVMTANFPHRSFWVKLIKGRTNANIEYRIQVPRGTNLAIHHDGGAVMLMDTGGNLDVTADHSDIVAQLATADNYAIDARVFAGRVDSDFAGDFHYHHWIGESFVTKTTTVRHAKLRLHFGDITLQQTVPLKYS